MFLAYIAILTLALWGAKCAAIDKPFNGALSRSRTDAIKGIFILIVFMRHIFPYISMQPEDFNYFDRLFIMADGMIRQLLVVMFLFYSGYGVAESIRVKGDSYIDGIPRRRVLTTLLNFAVAVSLFIILALIIGRELTIRQCLLSLIGWESVGNSNWYIFCILVLYSFTYVSYKIFKGNIKPLISLSVLSTLYIAVCQINRGGIGLIRHLLMWQELLSQPIKMLSDKYLRIIIGNRSLHLCYCSPYSINFLTSNSL